MSAAFGTISTASSTLTNASRVQQESLSASAYSSSPMWMLEPNSLFTSCSSGEHSLSACVCMAEEAAEDDKKSASNIGSGWGLSETRQMQCAAADPPEVCGCGSEPLLRFLPANPA